MTTLPFRRALLWLFTIAFNAAAFTASAEDSSTSARELRRLVPERAQVPQYPPQDFNPWSVPIQIDFPGGTLADFAKKLEPLPGISRIKVDNYSDAVLPPLKLRDKQPLGSVLQRMGVVASGNGGYFNAQIQSAQSSIDDTTELVLELSYSSINSNPSDRYIRKFDFPGGTVKQLADAIRNENLGITNIHITSSLANQAIPAFEVENITFGSLMSIIQRISERRCQLDLTGTFLEIGYKADPNSIQATATAIYPLRELLKTYRIEDINALVQTALKMRNTRIGTDEKDPDMSLHKETSTLVVVGSADQVKVVKDVLAALQDQPGDTKAPSPSPARNAP
jgi:hypothetical protein